MFTPPPSGMGPDELAAERMAATSMAGLTCENAGEALRRLSNQLLDAAAVASQLDSTPLPPFDPSRGMTREQLRRHYAQLLKSPVFWRKVWDRMADSFRSCDADCFDNGEAIGLISGTGYCAASLGVDGLPGPGFAYQPSLPLCGNAIFTGCQRGYQQAAATYAGCSAYTTGEFEPIFSEYQSQDCHIDP